MKSVIVALGLVDWEAAFVSGLGHPMLGMSVQRRCVDGVDVRAAIKVVAADVVIVSDSTPRLDQDLINELCQQNLEVIAIGSDEQFWLELGVTKFISLDLSNPLSAISKIAGLLRDKSDSLPVAETLKGSLIAVAGFGGSCGRSSFVKEVSWHLAKSGSRTLMVDADTYGASLIQEFAIDSGGVGVLEACREFEKRNLSPNVIEKLTHPVAPNLSLLSGLSKSSRWTDLRIPALRATWDATKSGFDFVVADVGGVLEIDSSLMHESALPRRHAASLTALEAAATTIICARADPIGVSRLIRGYLEFSELFSETNVSAVVWGTSNEREVRETTQAITRHTGLQSVTCVPHNWELAKTALSRATTMSKLDDKSAISITYRNLAQSLVSDEARIVGIETKKRTRPGIRSKRAA